MGLRLESQWQLGRLPALHLRLASISQANYSSGGVPRLVACLVSTLYSWPAVIGFASARAGGEPEPHVGLSTVEELDRLSNMGNNKTKIGSV